MTIHESQNATHSLRRASHRTLPEQLVGLGIYLAISMGIGMLSKFPQTFFFSFLISFGMWAIWRRYSLRVLKLELSLFLAQFLFQMIWSISFHLDQSLLVLVSLLLLSSNTLILALLFWKKEKISGILYVIPLLWAFYLSFQNMISCITNP